MRRRTGLFLSVMSVLALTGAGYGPWLDRVPVKDHERVSPFRTEADQESAAAGGAHIFYNECAKCHGNDGLGKDGRPAVISERVGHATEGDLFWLMTNGVPWHGMPAWDELPAKERWQLVSYLRALNAAGAGANAPAPASPAPSASASPAQPQ